MPRRSITRGVPARARSAACPQQNRRPRPLARLRRAVGSATRLHLRARAGQPSTPLWGRPARACSGGPHCAPTTSPPSPTGRQPAAALPRAHVQRPLHLVQPADGARKGEALLRAAERRRRGPRVRLGRRDGRDAAGARHVAPQPRACVACRERHRLRGLGRGPRRPAWQAPPLPYPRRPQAARAHPPRLSQTAAPQGR